jgi:hypothetical protein
MAVCNLFNALENPTGNFLMFSQYVEDLTKNYVDGEIYKVTPSRFIAMDVDYSKVDMKMLAPNGETMNEAIPKYFQNCFENSCAYAREHFYEFAQTNAGTKYNDWTPEISKNLFWNFMFDGKLCTIVKHGTYDKVNEIVYWGDINIQTYSERKGMGYGETYCYIPADSHKKNCGVIKSDENRTVDLSNNNSTLQGHNDIFIESYSKEYYYDKCYSMVFDDSDVPTLVDSSDHKYTFNTIVLLYDVYKKVNEEWIDIYKNIPMGIYFTGKFEGTTITNPIKKYVTSSYGIGTSYGLRICTRFTVSPNGVVLSNHETDIDSNDLSSYCQLMSLMSENISLMMDMSKEVRDTTQYYKEMLSTIKNNRVNVPYVKNVNGYDWWFVNGRPVTNISTAYDECCNTVTPNMINARIEAIKATLADENPENDYMNFDKIYTGEGCECEEQEVENVVNYIQGFDPSFEWKGSLPESIEEDSQ